MVTRHSPRAQRLSLVAVIMTVGIGIVALSSPSSADVTAVKGSAYGSFLSVSIFGSPVNTFGPDPTVNLPPGGSAVPITASAATQRKAFGPATFFTSGPVTVSTEGTTGPNGSVTSSTSTDTTNTSGQESFTAANISSTCSSSATGVVTGSTTVTAGVLEIDNGDVAPNAHPPVTVLVPTNPAPNTSYIGHIHVNGAQDNFRYVFNEQIVNLDGSLTVNAAHEYLLGPTAVGDLIIGQVICGLTGTPAPTTTTTVAPTTTTTRPPAECRPGNGNGDDNHCHVGPPGQQKKVASVQNAGAGGGALLVLVMMIGLVAFVRPRRS